MQGKIGWSQITGIRFLCCHCCKFCRFAEWTQLAARHLISIPAGTEICSCCRSDFNPNEWEVVESCNDVLQHRTERVRITREKHCTVPNRDGYFTVLAQDLAHQGSYSRLTFVGYRKMKGEEKEKIDWQAWGSKIKESIGGNRGKVQMGKAKQVSEKRCLVRKNFELLMDGEKP